MWCHKMLFVKAISILQYLLLLAVFSLGLNYERQIENYVCNSGLNKTHF
jgi:hypothetical protein